MKRITKDTLLAWAAALELLALLVLGAWPVPYKYPWGVPIAAVGTCAVCAIRSRAGDDFGAFLLGFTALAGLATWTIASWLRLDDERSVLLWIALLAVPVLWLITLVRGNSTELNSKSS